MKIRQLQVSILPSRYPGRDYYEVAVDVFADGHRFSSSTTVRCSDFEDIFGLLMRDAEHAIRKLVKEKASGEASASHFHT